MLWDVAAGCALVEAAGGRARLAGVALDKPLLVAASNAALAERVGAIAAV
jgi:myo-inositol-1(or 4)-monophosphatase